MSRFVKDEVDVIDQKPPVLGGAHLVADKEQNEDEYDFENYFGIREEFSEVIQ